MNEFNVVTHLEELDTESKNLVQKAKDATQHAYAPYSKFLVGAAILLEDGNIITGTNQENAAYPSGMCAERVALFSAISQYPKARIVKIAVVAKRDDSNVLVPATSCGPCRQVMLEFETRQSKIISGNYAEPGASMGKSIIRKVATPILFYPRKPGPSLRQKNLHHHYSDNISSFTLL